MSCGRNSRLIDSGRSDSRLQNLFAMLRVVAAVHRPTRQIDDHVCAVELSGPISNLLGIPASDTPRRASCRPPKDDDFVAIAMEDASQESPNLARAAGNHHPHAITDVGLTLGMSRALQRVGSMPWLGVTAARSLRNGHAPSESAGPHRR